MIIATGVYRGNYVDSVNSANLVEYFININSETIQNQSGKNWLESEQHNSDVPMVNIGKGSQKFAVPRILINTRFSLLKCYKRHFKM